MLPYLQKSRNRREKNVGLIKGKVDGVQLLGSIVRCSVIVTPVWWMHEYIVSLIIS